MADITPIILKACLAVVPRLTDKDYMFSVEALEKVWDVYRVNLPDGQVGQIALRLEGENVEFGWLGPRERRPAEIAHIIEFGFNTNLPDA